MYARPHIHTHVHTYDIHASSHLLIQRFTLGLVVRHFRGGADGAAKVEVEAGGRVEGYERLHKLVHVLLAHVHTPPCLNTRVSVQKRTYAYERLHKLVHVLLTHVMNDCYEPGSLIHKHVLMSTHTYTHSMHTPAPARTHTHTHTPGQCCLHINSCTAAHTHAYEHAHAHSQFHMHTLTHTPGGWRSCVRGKSLPRWAAPALHLRPGPEGSQVCLCVCVSHCVCVLHCLWCVCVCVCVCVCACVCVCVSVFAFACHTVCGVCVCVSFCLCLPKFTKMFRF